MENYKEDSAIELITILYEAGKQDDTIHYLNRWVDSNKNLPEKLIKIYVKAYKELFNKKRKTITIVKHDLDQIPSDRKFHNLEVEQFCGKLIKDLITLADKTDKIIKDTLLENCSTKNSRFVYLKLRADILRYKAEVTTDDLKQETIKICEECYKEAMNISQEIFEPYQSERLGIVLNYSVFLYEIVGNKKDGILLLESLFNGAVQYFKMNPDESKKYVRSRPYLQMIRDNITIWRDECYSDIMSDPNAYRLPEIKTEDEHNEDKKSRENKLSRIPKPDPPKESKN